MTTTDWRQTVGIDDTPPRPLCPLNPLELIVLRHLANGRTRDAAVRGAGLHLHSARNVVSGMLDKANAENTAHLVATALRNEWIR